MKSPSVQLDMNLLEFCFTLNLRELTKSVTLISLNIQVNLKCWHEDEAINYYNYASYFEEV